MIKYTPAFVDKLEDILSESGYTVRYERGNFQSGWCLLDHKRVVVLNKFLNTEGRVNTLVDLIPQLKIDFDKLTHSSQKIYEFLTKNHIKKVVEDGPEIETQPSEADLTSVESGDVEAESLGENEIEAEADESLPLRQKQASQDAGTSEEDPSGDDVEKEEA